MGFLDMDWRVCLRHLTWVEIHLPVSFLQTFSAPLVDDWITELVLPSYIVLEGLLIWSLADCIHWSSNSKDGLSLLYSGSISCERVCKNLEKWSLYTQLYCCTLVSGFLFIIFVNTVFFYYQTNQWQKKGLFFFPFFFPRGERATIHCNQ